MFTLSPLKRRFVYVSVFEVLAIVLSAWVLKLLSSSSWTHSLPLALIISLVAVSWNFIYNTAFEAWESKRQAAGRCWLVRCVHALGFEGGLFLVCLPLYMLWYKVGVWQAIYMETALMLFFLVYTFVFTLVFDQIFTLSHIDKSLFKN